MRQGIKTSEGRIRSPLFDHVKMEGSLGGGIQEAVENMKLPLGRKVQEIKT